MEGLLAMEAARLGGETIQCLTSHAVANPRLGTFDIATCQLRKMKTHGHSGRLNDLTLCDLSVDDQHIREPIRA